MIKKVLVYTYGKQGHTNTVTAAAKFAKQHNAHLTGVFVMPDMMRYSTVYGEYPLNLAQSFFDIQKEWAADTKKQFEQIVDGVGCQAEWHEIDEYEKLPNPAFYADYIFVTQADEKSPITFDDAQFIDRMVVDTGLPLVVIPQDWTSDTIAGKPALGWKECREAVSAVRSALYLMSKAEEVDILTVVDSVDDEANTISGIEISEYLASHDVKCKYFPIKRIDGERSEAEALIRHVLENNRDAIIIGGYGHSRFRETILGGVTRGLLRNSPVPVVLSH